MNSSPPADLPVAAWRKSTRSTGGGSNCVEVACLPSRIAIRDSKHREGGMLIVTTAVFRELTGGIRRGVVSGWYSIRVMTDDGDAPHGAGQPTAVEPRLGQVVHT